MTAKLGANAWLLLVGFVGVLAAPAPVRGVDFSVSGPFVKENERVFGAAPAPSSTDEWSYDWSAYTDYSGDADVDKLTSKMTNTMIIIVGIIGVVALLVVATIVFSCDQKGRRQQPAKPRPVVMVPAQNEVSIV